MPPKVHKFDRESSGEVYDTTQTVCFCGCADDDVEGHEIANGDVLVVESEGMVGILVEAWPVALHQIGDAPSEASFHLANDDLDWANLIQAPYEDDSPTKDYTKSVELAKEEFDMLLTRRSEAQGERDHF